MSIQASLTSGPTVMMTLGGYRFGILTAAYQELARVTEWRWPSQERFMQGQALQYVGPGGDTITLPGVIYPEWRGGPGQLNAMRAEADQGSPLPLIDGGGNVMGRWVIERIEERQTVFAAGGAPRKQEFTLALRKFDDSGGGFGLFDALADAAFLDGLGDTAAASSAGPAGVISSAINAASQAASVVSAAVADVQAVATQIGTAANTVLSPVIRCVDIANGLKNAAQDARAMLGSSTTALAQSSSLTQLINASVSSVANIGQASASLKRATASLGTLPTAAANAVQGAQIATNKLTVAAVSIQTAASDALKKLTA